MAATAAGRALTEAHRVAQVEIAKRVIARLAALWPSLDVDALDGLVYQQLVQRLVTDGRADSAKLAGAYLEQFIEAEGLKIPGSPRVALAAEVDLKRLDVSARVTGSVAAKKRIARGLTPEQAMARTFGDAANAIMRHVLGGGRSAVVDTAQAGGYAVARVADGDPCYFCAMLAGRGAVYHDSASASFEAHDGCGCTVEIAADRDNYQLPPGSARFAEIYEKHSHGTGREKLNDFRRAYERPELHPDD